MVQGIEGFPSKLQPSLLSDLEGFGKGHIKVVDTAGHECVPTYRGSIRQTKARLHPVNVSRGDAQTSIRIAVSGCAKPGAGRWRSNRAASEGCARIADVGTVSFEAVVVAVEAVQKGERST